jgi:L-fuculokinase
MNSPLALVLDCGATNIRAIGVDVEGKVASSASLPNNPRPQPGRENLLIWDLDEIWDKMCECSKKVLQTIHAEDIKAVTTTTFGADGAPLKEDGSLAYPIISWQCSRTEPTMLELNERMDPWEVYQETGYQNFSFNTVLKFLWLKKHEPGVFSSMKKFLFTPGLISEKLTGELSVDATIASTSVMMNLRKRKWSDRMLSLLGIDESVFPRWVEPGEVIGQVTSEAAAASGLPAGLPVIACGHDTQFAPLGAGAAENEAVLSSGTWEILLFRDAKFEPNRYGFEEGLITEADPTPGFWHPQLLMMASGVLEWLRRNLFADIGEEEDVYAKMISEGQKSPLGAKGVTVLPAFMQGTGPTKKYNTAGTILGLNLHTERGDVYRAALEGLAFQLKNGIQVLSKATGFKPKGIRVVGGGSKNDLWNQIRADVTGLKVTTIKQKESTVLGAAIVAFAGAGIVPSIEEAARTIPKVEAEFKPERDAKKAYRALYKNYLAAAKGLKRFYQA